MFIACDCPSWCVVHATTVPCDHCGAPRGTRCAYRNGRRRGSAHAKRERRLTSAFNGLGLYWEQDRRAWVGGTGTGTERGT